MTDIVEQLRKILPANAVLDAPADCAAYETDWRRLYNYPALCVVLPETTQQVAQIVKLCGAAKIAIVPQGGNTGLVASGVPAAKFPQIVLNLRRMHNIRSIDTVSDTITVEAGATLQSVQDEAASVHRQFPVSFAARGTAQIGGVISTNAGGVQVLSYGSMRAQVLGLEVVLADGRIWDGLRALRKDNTGFDLKQMFIGAEGTLGIITAACLRLWPAVTSWSTALVGIGTVPDALKLFQALRAKAGAALTLCEFISQPAMVLGAAHTPSGKPPFEAAAYVLIEISAHSTEENVADAMEAVLAAALEDGTATDAVIAQSIRERDDLLALREAVPEGELIEGGAVKHDIAVTLALIPDTVAAIEKLVREKYPDCRLNIFGHIGDGNLHVNVRPPAGQTLASLSDRKAAITADVEALAVARGGSFSAEHGIGQMRLTGMRAHKSAVELDLMRAVKQALDPRGLLNPGKVIPEETS